jgi:hypothetical protein
MCVNMTGSGVNKKLQALKFLYPPFDDCTDLCYPGAWMAKVDLTDGFFHRLVRPSDRKYLGLRIPATDELCRYTVFPFGLSVSPHYFSAAISEAHRLLRKHPLFKGAPVVNLPSQPGFDPAKPVVYQVTSDYKNYDVDVELTAEAAADLRWWQQALPHFRRARVVRGAGSISIRQHTDASAGGWGCTIEQYRSKKIDYCFGLFGPHI